MPGAASVRLASRSYPGGLVRASSRVNSRLYSLHLPLVPVASVPDLCLSSSLHFVTHSHLPPLTPEDRSTFVFLSFTLPDGYTFPAPSPRARSRAAIFSPPPSAKSVRLPILPPLTRWPLYSVAYIPRPSHTQRNGPALVPGRVCPPISAGICGFSTPPVRGRLIRRWTRH
ncbi:unnamed protein product [Prunus armeniaca]|uniref:Uncharacterized protein n=1 Tax=Prunus armeniaca TaxID=36596 RepID=A0A6J5U8L1_PRUAR|nr:unnamed protein product [Prunus armeniaca]